MARFELPVLLLLSVHSTCGVTPAETPVPVERKEIDRDGNGKVDSLDESYKLGDDLQLRVLERIDKSTGKLQVRATPLTFQGTPFWTEMRLSDETRVITVERRCPFGIGSTDSSVVLFDGNRTMVAALNKNEQGRWIPTSQDEFELARGMLDTLRELEEAARDEANRSKDQSVVPLQNE